MLGTSLWQETWPDSFQTTRGNQNKNSPLSQEPKLSNDSQDISKQLVLDVMEDDVDDAIVSNSPTSSKNSTIYQGLSVDVNCFNESWNSANESPGGSVRSNTCSNTSSPRNVRRTLFEDYSPQARSFDSQYNGLPTSYPPYNTTRNTHPYYNPLMSQNNEMTEAFERFNLSPRGPSQPLYCWANQKASHINGSFPQHFSQPQYSSLRPAPWETKTICQVSFKRSTDFYNCDKILNDVSPGEFVFVDADRGEHIGRVRHVLIVSLEDASLYNLKGSVLRKGNIHDTQQLMQNKQEELEAVVICNKKIKEHNLDLRVIDAEFQFDRKKLTFFYTAEKRVDFRTLIRDLYKTYRARIWMEKIY